MASLRAVDPKSTHRTSAAAMQNSGIPITSGKSAAFHGHENVLNTPQPASAMMPSASASDALLGMRPLPGARAPRLYKRIDDHHQRDADEHQHHRPREPGRAVARHGDVQIILGDLAQHQAQDERRTRPARGDHEIADSA